MSLSKTKSLVNNRQKKKTEFGCKDENYASSTHESELKESNTKYKISLYLIPF